MKGRVWLAGVLLALLWATPAKADTGIIIRTTGGLPALQLFCSLPLSPCTIIGALDGTLGQVFLVTTPLDPTVFIGLLGGTVGGLTGFVDAEVNQLLSLIGGLNVLPPSISPTLMSDRSSVAYPAGSSTPAWNSYVNQPAASIVEIQNAQQSFNVLGTGVVVADIDTGVDPTHPALQGVLLPGYDFTRNQPNGSELNDVTSSDFSTYPPPTCSSSSCPAPAQVNQSTAAVLDQSTAAVLDGNGTPKKYAAFGHGTMVMGIIHLVAPTAQLMPLKAFHSDGTASLSDILRAIYYGAQNGANVINMSFDLKTSSVELGKALDYANQQNVICAASSGNDGTQEIVYPAALQNDVMGVASTTNQDTRSQFSNYGNAIVWVAAPGESIVSTYPFATYAAGWGTSFSAPFVSGGAALLRNVNTTIAQSGAASATAHAVALADPGMNNGRLDLCMSLASAGTGSCSPDYSVSAAPSTTTITAGQQASFTVSAAPLNGSKQTVTWDCMGAPQAATCTVSPSSVVLNGSSAATATVTLTTTARPAVTPRFLPRIVPPMQLRVTTVTWFALAVIVLIVCSFGRIPRQRAGLATLAGLLTVSLCAYSCGYANNPGPGSGTLSSLTLNPTSVNGGSSATGTVTLSGAAPGGGAVINLSSSAPAATVPSSVTIIQGYSSGTFTVNTTTVTASTPVTITASYADVSKTASLTVMPPAPAGTPAGSYTLTVTGTSGGVSRSTTVQVVVN